MSCINIVLLVGLLVPAVVFGNVIEKFGCSFLNEEYEVNENILKIGGYGKPVEPLQIQSEEKLKYLVSEMKALRGEVLQENIYDNVDSFLDFYEQVAKANASNNLGEFLKNYKTKFYELPHTDSMGITIAILERFASFLSEIYKKIGDHLFIGAVQYDIFTSKEQLLAVDEKYFSTELGKRITNIVGVLRFSLSDRPGFVVFDAGFSESEEVFVVMDDGENPFKDIEASVSDQNKEDALELEIHPKNNKLIIGKNTIENKPLYVLINVAQPYCLPRQAPQKADLLNYKRYMVLRNADTSISFGFYFHALPSANASDSNANTNYVFNAVINDEYEKACTKLNGKDFNVKDASTFKHLDAADKHVLLEITSTLGTNSEELVSKFRRIQKLMNDNKFLIAHKKLSSQFYDDSHNLASKLVH